MSLGKLGIDLQRRLIARQSLAEIPLVCDRVIIIHDGRVVDEQAAAAATESSMLTAAHGLEAAA